MSGDLVSRPGRCWTHPPVHSNAQRARSALPALGHKGALYHIQWSWVLEDQVPVEKPMASLKQSPASALNTIKSKNRQSVQEIKGPVCDSLCPASSGKTHHKGGPGCCTVDTAHCTLYTLYSAQCTSCCTQHTAQTLVAAHCKVIIH